MATVARRHPAVREELGEALDHPRALRALLVQNQVRAWVGGKGTNGVGQFSFDGQEFSTTSDLPGELQAAARELLSEIVEWRLAECTDRVGGS